MYIGNIASFCCESVEKEIDVVTSATYKFFNGNKLLNIVAVRIKVFSYVLS
jgi:hypothetical protein